jgi:ssDNA-binding replication factor A large subunit
MENYKQLLEKIALAARLGVAELERKIEAKRARLSGLVSKEGAAQIVAAELGINLDRERLKLSELVEGMKRANVKGKILQISPVRSYSRNGRDGKVVNLLIADESSNAKTVLWDTNHIRLVEEGKLNIGDTIEVGNASVRNGELHLSSFGDIKLSKELLGEVVSAKVFASHKIAEAKAGQGLKTRAVIVQVFEPRYFEVCPECGKKANDSECSVHGKISAKKRALLNVVIDDGSESIRSVFFGEHILKLGFSEDEIFSLDLFNAKKDSILGEEMLFSGNVRQNSLYNTMEFSIDEVQQENADELIKELEAKQ